MLLRLPGGAGFLMRTFCIRELSSTSVELCGGGNYARMVSACLPKLSDAEEQFLIGADVGAGEVHQCGNLVVGCPWAFLS